MINEKLNFYLLAFLVRTTILNWQTKVFENNKKHKQLMCTKTAQKLFISLEAKF